MHVTIEAAVASGNEDFIKEYDGHLTEQKQTPEGAIYYNTDI